MPERRPPRPRQASRRFLLTDKVSGVKYAPHRRDEAANQVGRAVRRARERSAVRGYRAASRAIARIPIKASLPVGKSLFVASYYAWPAKRRIILSNASHVLGLPTSDKRVRNLARRVYATYATFILELMRLPHLAADEPTRLLDRLDGDHGGESFIALFERLRAQNRGLIAVSGHIGSIDLLAGAFALRGLPTYGLADDSAYPELFEEMNAQRRRWGIEVIPWRNLRKVFSALREPAILGLVVDWGYRADGIPVRLFGEWTALPAGPAMLAAKTNAAIVPVVCRRLPDGRYDARHYDPIEVADSSAAELQRATQKIADALEDMISTAPEQWYSFKPVWPETKAEKEALAERAVGVLGAGA
jgi:lauroyl/myristoyl acyltransferase